MGLRRAGIRRRGAGGPGARSPPSRVDPIIVRGAEASLVGGEEQRHRGDVGRLDAAVQALGGDDFRLALRRIPLLLPLGLDIAGHDRVDADIVAPQLARSEEHTSELQSIMRISYAVFSLKK